MMQMIKRKNMPFVKTGNNTYKSPSGRTFTKKQVKMYYATDGFTKKKAKLVVNNKMKGALGASEFKKGNVPTGKIEINVKAHKGDRAELASTIKHELMHVKKPNATEKEVYKATAKTKISPKEQTSLIAKLRHKKSDKPGDLYNRFQTKKKLIPNNDNQSIPKIDRVAIMGMV